MNLSTLLANQVFAGVAGAAVMSAVLYQLRSLPMLAWTMLKTQFSATLTVYSEQEASFRQFDLWLGRHPSAQNTRRLALAEWWDQAASHTETQLTPGEGPHVLWEGRRPVFVHKTVEQAAPNGGGPGAGTRRQTLTITTVGRDRAHLRRIMEEARTVQDRDVVPVFIWGGYGYELVERRPRRALATIYLADGLRDAIVADARRFRQRKDWYGDRGIPHRRGYLFEGPPGTGKSSMALALAGELHRSIYIINPAAVADDNALQTAINQAGSGLVLIEDIDAIDCSRERTAPRGRKGEPALTGSPAKVGISPSGLLNAIDGVAARDGRILIITSNHADRLDPALIRPGRVDMRCEFRAAELPEAMAMFARFCPEGDADAFATGVAPDLPLTQAELQNRLLRIAA